MTNSPDRTWRIVLVLLIVATALRWFRPKATEIILMEPPRPKIETRSNTVVLEINWRGR